MSDQCVCSGCAALAAECAGDPVLLDLCRCKLLIRGWAGKRTPAEKAHMRAHASWVQAIVASSVGRLPPVSKKQAQNTAISGRNPRTVDI